MPGDIDIKVDTSEVEQYLSQIGDPKRVRRITRKALRKGAEITREAIAERAPERPDLPSGSALPIGALKADIIVTSSTDQNGNEVAMVRPGKLTDHVAGWVEYGHQMVTGGRRRENADGSVSGNGRLTKVRDTTDSFVAAHPFFRPGAEESAEAAASAIVESLAADAVRETAAGDDAAA